MISLLVCCPRTVQSDLFKAWVRSHLMVSRCHTEWNPCARDLRALGGWLPNLASRPRPLTKLQSHRLPPCPGEHPPSASPVACTELFLSGLDCLLLHCLFRLRFMLRKHLPFREPPLITLLFTLLRFTWIVHFIYSEVGSNHTACLIVQLCLYCHVALWVSVVLVCKWK